MTIYQFTLLNEKDKADLVLNSILVAEKQDDDRLFQLYYLDNIFVEIWHDRELRRIYSMRPYSFKRIPEEYLDMISIGEIAE